MPRRWLRDEQTEIAVRRILETVSKTFVERGAFRTGMREIAGAAGCSRGTVYRYFPNREALRAEWLVRVVVSLLTLPGESAGAERDLVRRFVAPGLLAAGRE